MIIIYNKMLPNVFKMHSELLFYLTNLPIKFNRLKNMTGSLLKPYCKHYVNVLLSNQFKYIMEICKE